MEEELPDEEDPSKVGTIFGPGAAGLEPTNADSEKARREALSMLRREFSRFAADHEDIVQDAAIYCHAKWDPERSTYPAFVCWKAKLEALSKARSTTLLVEVPLDDDSALSATEADEVQTIEALRAKVLTECRVRLLTVTGGEGERWLANVHASGKYLTPAIVNEMKARTIAARKILRALEGIEHDDWLMSEVNVEALRHYAALEPDWHTWSAKSIGIGYDDGSAGGAFYGATGGESAVLSILAGSMPKLDVTMSVKDVIHNEAEAIRKAASKRERARDSDRQRSVALPPIGSTDEPPEADLCRPCADSDSSEAEITAGVARVYKLLWTELPEGSEPFYLLDRFKEECWRVFASQKTNENVDAGALRSLIAAIVSEIHAVRARHYRQQILNEAKLVT